MLGAGKALPNSVLTNRELYAFNGIRQAFDVERARKSLRNTTDSDRMSPEEVFDQWAVQLAGIRERRILLPGSGLTTEDLLASAGRAALSDAGLDAGDINHIVVGSMTGSDVMPNPGCTVAEKLGIPGTSAYTLNAACSGFTFALAQAWASIRSGMVGTTLVIGGDVMSRVTNYADPKTAVLFGDGAGAVVLGVEGDGPRIVGKPALAGSYARDPLWLVGQGWESTQEPLPKLHMAGGPSILRRAVGHMMRVGEKALTSAGRDWSDVTAVVPHQANERITLALAKRLALPRGRVISTIERYGNLSAGTVSVALAELLTGDLGTAPTEGLILLTAVGGGYAAAAVALDLEA